MSPFVRIRPQRDCLIAMTTLLEIESAAAALPPPQQFELLGSLATRLSGAPSGVEQQFAELAAAWRKDTAFTSSLTELFAHPAYQRIIGLGVAVLPLIFRELAREPDYWFGALQAITGCDPVPLAHRGNLEQMTADWLAWGRMRGWVSA